MQNFIFKNFGSLNPGNSGLFHKGQGHPEIEVFRNNRNSREVSSLLQIMKTFQGWYDSESRSKRVLNLEIFEEREFIFKKYVLFDMEQ